MGVRVKVVRGVTEVLQCSVSLTCYCLPTVYSVSVSCIRSLNYPGLLIWWYLFMYTLLNKMVEYDTNQLTHRCYSIFTKKLLYAELPFPCFSLSKVPNLY